MRTFNKVEIFFDLFELLHDMRTFNKVEKSLNRAIENTIIDV